MEIAIDSLPAIPVEKRLTVLQDVYEFILSGDIPADMFERTVDEWIKDSNYVNAIEQIPIEDRAELQRLLIYKILY